MDRDFPPASRDCDGLVVIRGQADEGGGDYRCPTCERIVYPDADGKDLLETLAILLRCAGIEKFLIEHCGKDARGRQFRGGVLTLTIDCVTACICLPEFCSNSLLLRRSAAMSQTSIYVTVEPDASGHWHSPRCIPRILTGEVDLCGMLRDRVRNGPPDPSRSSLRTFTDRVARNCIASLIEATQAKKRGPGLEILFSDWMTFSGENLVGEDSGAEPDQTIGFCPEPHLNLRTDLWRAFDRLPATLRTCFLVLFDNTIADAARRTGASRSSTYHRIAELRAQFEAAGLRAYLADPDNFDVFPVSELRSASIPTT